MRGLISRRVFTMSAVGLLASCASPSPALYTLDPPPGAVRRGGPKTVELRTVGIARYLERSQIVRSSENYRLDVLPNDWWGEPLDAMLGRVLSQALSQRLGGALVYVENGAISAEPGATVQINVRRMDQTSSGAVVLVAQYAIQRKAPETREVTLPVPARGSAPADLVAAMSVAIGQLADRIAAGLGV